MQTCIPDQTSVTHSETVPCRKMSYYSETKVNVTVREISVTVTEH